MNVKGIMDGGFLSIVITLLFSVLCCTAMAADLTKNEKKVVADSIRNKLTDPDSAKFKWLPLVGKTQSVDGIVSASYCGLVNSKNRMGGYTGDAPFIVLLIWVNNKPLSAVVGVGTADWESIESKSTVQHCAIKGYDKLYLVE